jgi:hypothetical protein
MGSESVLDDAPVHHTFSLIPAVGKDQKILSAEWAANG